jgi:ribosomal protein S6--L-glutamate ligase
MLKHRKYRGGIILNQFDAIIPRIRPSITFYGCALTRQFEALKVYCLNSAAAITQSRDKLYSTLIKQWHRDSYKQDLLILLRYQWFNQNGRRFAHSKITWRYKERSRSCGNKKAAESVINAFKSLNANILVQELKEANGRHRCFVIDGKVVAPFREKRCQGI